MTVYAEENPKYVLPDLNGDAIAEMTEVVSRNLGLRQDSDFQRQPGHQDARRCWVCKSKDGER
jgi:hypothetical protein